MNIENVLSVFDGMSCGQIALERVGFKPKKYYASEIKKSGIKITQLRYPKTIQLGDIMNINWFGLPRIDLLIGGSPCQDISKLKPGMGIYDEKSKLFFQYLRLKKELNPKYFLLENVVGDKKSIDLITNLMEVEPIRINSSLLSFQNRDRYYWTNIPNVTIPTDLNINFQDYKESDEIILDQFIVNRTPSREIMWRGKCPDVTNRKKINCLTCKQDRWNNSGLVAYKDFCRYLTIKECELAQTVPIGYTDGISINQAWDLLGDGWTIDVICHILKNIK